MLYNFTLFTIVVLLLILYKIKDIPNEHFKVCSNVIRPSCNKRYLFREIDKLEDKLNKLSYIVKSRSMDKAKVNQMYLWYKNKERKESEFTKSAQKNVNKQIAAFARETNSRMAKDRKRGDKIHRKSFASEKKKLDKAYKPLRI